MSWAVIKESTDLFYASDKKTGHARGPILVLSLRSPIVSVRGNPRDVITLRLDAQPAETLWNHLESSAIKIVAEAMVVAISVMQFAEVPAAAAVAAALVEV
ncbi:hypothetical protein PoB_005068600 [Plakobranchus ocellatus]|uniref:Uncharacterized protein n=1 Tax=Plakobranchus ocellatus TaxID=259542 RepID=A0AAV4BYI4_9GAST|nr:hypothetical protein PoB_005068600 [Plakobranchus ocellatus]